jgi:hypothetical protein
LVFNFAPNHRLPQMLFQGLAHGDLCFRSGGLAKMRVERRCHPAGRMLGVARDCHNAGFHARSQQRASDRNLLGVEDNPGYILNRQANLAIVLNDNNLLVCETQTRRPR